MRQALFGVETEYAFTAHSPEGVRLDCNKMLDRLESIARRKLCHLPCEDRGIFLQNASRLYRDPADCGTHEELACPEVQNPWDAGRYLLAGERFLAGLAADLAREDPEVGVASFFKTNVDYHRGSKSSWGCHESYLVRKPIEHFVRPLVPHLVSRIVFTGAGGFDPLCPGLHFTLSPRVAHLHVLTGMNTGTERPLFHMKDEPHARKYHRLHLVCGESLNSQTATWLKAGTTALIVSLIDAGFRPDTNLKLADPLHAMRLFAADPTCTARAEMKTGDSLSATMIQRQYLEFVEKHIGGLPPWADEVCRQWRRMLDRLENGAPESVADILDWAIKFPLYRARVLARGLKWESLPEWTGLLANIERVLEKGNRFDPVTAAVVFGPSTVLGSDAELMRQWLHGRGLVRRDLEAFLDLRLELFEIDTRFSQLEEGIFAALDRAGVLNHRFPGVDNIEHAMENPPAEGRAHLRGECVRRFGRINGGERRYVADWSGVLDTTSGRFLDLSDPFNTRETWRQVEVEAKGELDAITLNNTGVELRNEGRLTEAEALLRRALEKDIEDRGAAHPKIPHRLNNLSTVLVMLGKLDEAKGYLAKAWGLKRGRHDITSARILFVRLAVALLETQPIDPFLGKMKGLLTGGPLSDHADVTRTWDIGCFIEHLRPRLGSGIGDFLIALAAAVNDRSNLPGVDSFQAWREAAPETALLADAAAFAAEPEEDDVTF